MRRLVRLLALVASLALLSGCSSLPFATTNATACEPPRLDAELQHVDGLYVLPDDRREPVIEEIDRAACTIDVTIYLLSDEATIDALLRAEARGVAVRIIHEPAPFGGGVGVVETTESLAEHGIELGTGPDELRFVHAKYLVIDRQVGIVTNQNLTYSAFESNRELGIITTVPEDVAALAAIFEADWSETAAPKPPERMILSPVNSRDELLSQIRSAETTVRLYAEVIRDDEIIDALSTAVQRGVDVRVLVNAPDDDLDDVVYATLEANAVDIRIAGHVYIHAKGMMIDDQSMVVGSHNPTATSLDQNREVSLIIDDPFAIARAIAIFDQDWNRSDP